MIARLSTRKNKKIKKVFDSLRMIRSEQRALRRRTIVRPVKRIPGTGRSHRGLKGERLSLTPKTARCQARCSPNPNNCTRRDGFAAARLTNHRLALLSSEISSPKPAETLDPDTPKIPNTESGRPEARTIILVQQPDPRSCRNLSEKRL